MPISRWSRSDSLHGRSISSLGVGLLVACGLYWQLGSSPPPVLLFELAVPTTVGLGFLWYGAWIRSDRIDCERPTIVSGCSVAGGVLTAGLFLWSFALGAQSASTVPESAGLPLLHGAAVGTAFGGVVGHLAVYRSRHRRETDRLSHAVDAAMDAIAVVADDRLVFANDAYASLYGLSDPGTLEGRLWGEQYTNESLVTIERDAIPAVVRNGRWEGTLTGRRVDGTTFQQHVTISAHDREGSYVVVARDVTDQLDREQRIQVLNRVLRHNLRNAFTVIRGHANLLGEHDETLERRHVDPIREEIDDLLATADKARGVERKLERHDRTETIEATDALRSVVDRARAAYPSVRIVSRTETTTADSGSPVVDAAVVDALDELVDNAVEHQLDGDRTGRPDSEPVSELRSVDEPGDVPTVELSVEVAEYTSTSRLEFTVADDGDGIPESERRAVLEGTETQLAHGSGLGLWFVSWITGNAGGDVQFADRPGGGTAVTLSFPQETRGEDQFRTAVAEHAA
ncbi:sensor histidine kinase [Natrarchaeobius chitinivorans]|uniref:histidine kinase n=1 Tax=Natrarchaeobius chitinivorans TaxID=1679083 RepID=A0A3N6MZJ8_NATCH|nr:PAS domain-containing sensor histidine kinase [Natrarchaeobius chitinivorans]RQG91022.1 PAS domain-containing sensor histidine kinase [Natrarchaeobius chitinivorans]